MDAPAPYRAASIKTGNSLKTVALTKHISEISHMTLPEIEAVVDLVAQVIPAGNVPGMILSGLSRLPERRPPLATLQRDINLLFKGVEQTLDKAVYAAFFAGPAAVIWGYQNLLKLAGKDPATAFPEGTWQFYVDYALREDTARHANETHGFDTRLAEHGLHLGPVDRVTAWAMAAIHLLHQYPALLANEWRERVHTRLLRELTANTPHAAPCARLYRAWETRRPYSRHANTPADQTYSDYRRAQFDAFLAEAMRDLPAPMRQRWVSATRVAEAEDLPAYQQQMSLLAYLDPGAYGETRTTYSATEARVGIIAQRRYFLLPICAAGSAEPLDVHVARAQIAALLSQAPSASPPSLAALARVKRAQLPALRAKLNPDFVREWDALRRAPILLNTDQRPRALPLSEIRQAERGVGDHGLTIFDTGESFVFDQSHILFDGAWGAALAEIFTNEALSWAVYLHSLPPVTPTPHAQFVALGLRLTTPELSALAQAPQATPEVGAATEAVNLKAIQTLRKAFKQRNDQLQLTINDLLVLYRAIHAVTYRPSAALVNELLRLNNEAARLALDEIENSRRQNPAILIPIDASQHDPVDRLYPLSFEVPLADLDLLNLHAQVLQALTAYETAKSNRAAAYNKFEQLQRTYLAALAGFGAVLSKAKDIALMGESASVGAIKLLAGIPKPLQKLLDAVPGRFGVLNDLIKGREVFSNVGAVAPTSTLSRFITAKDDNDKKTLAWGAMTDATGILRLTLRDFRPHVGALIAIGQRELAERLAQDYIEVYARGLNDYTRDLRRITQAGRETRLEKA
jgi:hypothetical protein